VGDKMLDVVGVDVDLKEDVVGAGVLRIVGVDL
jgi:hypothetical protein